MHIDIRDGVLSHVALECVRDVVLGGRCSNRGESYCYATSFITEDGVVWVYTRRNSKSDCFVVCKGAEQESTIQRIKNYDKGKGK